MTMPPVVLAQHVTKWYGPRRAVSDVSFAIEPGEIVGLLGPNGSGKSTIFRILTGYLAPSSGRVEVAGHDVVTDSPAVRQAISYVPEDAPLYDHMRGPADGYLHWPKERMRKSRTRRRRGRGAARWELRVSCVRKAGNGAVCNLDDRNIAGDHLRYCVQGSPCLLIFPIEDEPDRRCRLPCPCVQVEGTAR
jgi:ABC-type sugar transport system ATPase subunit